MQLLDNTCLNNFSDKAKYINETDKYEKNDIP